MTLPGAGPSPEKPKLRPETIRMRREKRGGGREVVILEGFPKGGFDLEVLAGELKKALGAGGTVRGFEIEIHGDHRDRLAELLLARGFRSKRAGG